MMNVRSELSPGGQRVLDYMCITPADSSQMSISAGRCGDGLEGRQSIHSVLLMMRMPVIRSILQNTSSDFCPPDSVIIVDSDWKDIANIKSLLYYNKVEKLTQKRGKKLSSILKLFLVEEGQIVSSDSGVWSGTGTSGQGDIHVSDHVPGPLEAPPVTGGGDIVVVVPDVGRQEEVEEEEVEVEEEEVPHHSHTTKHTSQVKRRKRVCEVCGKEVLDIKNHMAGVHKSAIIPLKCLAPACDHIVESGRKWDLKRHMEGINCRSNQTRCELCGCWVVSVQSLRHHYKRRLCHYQFACTVCPLRFRTMDLVKGHMLAGHGDHPA